MQIFHLVLAGLFLVAAALQYNDPDPLVWGTYYLAATVGAGLYAAKRPTPAVAWMCIGASIIFLLQCLTGVINNLQNTEGFAIASMSAERPEIEETREFGGAMIVLFWSIIAMLTQSKRPAPYTSSSSENPNSANQ